MAASSRHLNCGNRDEPRSRSSNPGHRLHLVRRSRGDQSLSEALLVEQTSPSSRTASDEDLDPKAKMGIVDLCAGIGCVAGGFEATRAFETIALVDIDLDAQRAWQRNHSHAEYLSVDIQELEAGQLLQCADGRGIDGIVGCPPCQGFSAAGQRRNDDERNKLLASFFDVVSTLSPRFFVMENVPAVLHREELRAQEEALANRYEIRADLNERRSLRSPSNAGACSCDRRRSRARNYALPAFAHAPRKPSGLQLRESRTRYPWTGDPSSSDRRQSAARGFNAESLRRRRVSTG
jgi:hypothetical protein